MSEYTAYCVKCKEKGVKIKDPKPASMGKGKWAVTGTHEKCGTKLFRIVGLEKPKL